MQSRARLALGAAALVSSACTQTTTIVDSDGWHYDGSLLSSDADSVTIEGHSGPVVIPRSEVIDYDLPGDGLIIAGACVALAGLVALPRQGGGQTRSTERGMAGGLAITLGASLAGWGWWVWDDADETWSGPATEVSVGVHGVQVRF